LTCGLKNETSWIKGPLNIGGAYRQGVETVAYWQLALTPRLALSCLWQQSGNRDNGKELAYTPEP
jgi:hypothetical protein